MPTTASAKAPEPLLEHTSPSLVPELRRYIACHQAEVLAMIRPGREEAGLPAGQRYAKMYDGMLSALFSAVRGLVSQKGSWPAVSLAGVGSYGRGAVAFHSDLDVRLLCTSKPAAARPIAEALLYPL
ncbi:MAG TPA: hypothetical protein VGJ84_15460, partial [Polyangiaceae bacterium]